MAEQHSTYKLYYFKAKALGEPIRMLFAYGGIKYEDIRYERFTDEWPKIKKCTNRIRVSFLAVFSN